MAGLSEGGNERTTFYEDDRRGIPDDGDTLPPVSLEEFYGPTYFKHHQDINSAME